MTDLEVRTLTPADGIDKHDLEDIRAEGLKWMDTHVPPRFAGAIATEPLVRQWAFHVIEFTLGRRRIGHPVVRTGPSLLLLGPVGTGKTHQAYGALRAISVSGVVCHWQAITESALFAQLQPRAGIDSEAEYARISAASVLLIDDIGAVRRTEWNEGILLRLINDRYEQVRPTLITSNVRPGDFGATFGDRVTSRLTEMATPVTLTGPDRRRKP
jgi:DNA replication protein DnaC